MPTPEELARQEIDRLLGLAGWAVQDVAVANLDAARGVAVLRDDLIQNGVLSAEGEAFRFTQDYAFSSPSAASDLVLGGSTNGRPLWKDGAGKTLKSLQERELLA